MHHFESRALLWLWLILSHSWQYLWQNILQQMMPKKKKHATNLRWLIMLSYLHMRRIRAARSLRRRRRWGWGCCSWRGRHWGCRGSRYCRIQSVIFKGINMFRPKNNQTKNQSNDIAMVFNTGHPQSPNRENSTKGLGKYILFYCDTYYGPNRNISCSLRYQDFGQVAFLQTLKANCCFVCLHLWESK